VFPNPAMDKFFVRFENVLNNANIKLTDANGKEIYELNNISGTTMDMNADKLSKGIYFINVYEKNKIIGRSKIVIQ